MLDNGMTPYDPGFSNYIRKIIASHVTKKSLEIPINRITTQEIPDPNNLLETGIEIIATPPGKNMKSISLLSGGEKTLTAISLLFSIMNLKKVPFVILDEVESALDDVNAEKFGEYLSNYRNKTQLLVITHKKKTMEFLDLL